MIILEYIFHNGAGMSFLIVDQHMTTFSSSIIFRQNKMKRIGSKMICDRCFWWQVQSLFHVKCNFVSMILLRTKSLTPYKIRYEQKDFTIPNLHPGIY